MRDDCRWSHSGGLSGKEDHICTPVNGEGTLNQNHTGLWNCVIDAACPIVDDRLQFVVLRDPRAVTVSYYFYKKLHNKSFKETSVDVFVINMLPTVCQWVSLRFLLFEQILKTQSSLFWYSDAFADSEQWHEHFLQFVGLNMPHDVVKAAANTATDGGEIPGMHRTGVNVHLGGAEAELSRTYQDEITAETLAGMDDVLRVWLPPILLTRLGVALFV